MFGKKNNNGTHKKEMLTVTYLATKELKKIKYKEITQAYNLFVSALKLEDESVRNKEHFWVLGIDVKGFVVCVYTVSLGSSNITTFAPVEIFQYAMQRGCVRVIFAHNHTNVSNNETLKPSKQDLETTNWLFYAARYLGIQLLDHLIINLYTFCSLHKIGEMKKIEEDMKFKTYDEVKPKLDDDKAEAVKIAKLEEKIDMAKTMLEKKYTLDQIIDISKLTIEGIKKIKKDVQIDLVKNMLKLSPDEIDEIVKISALSKDEVLKIKKDMKK